MLTLGLNRLYNGSPRNGRRLAVSVATVAVSVATVAVSVATVAVSVATVAVSVATAEGGGGAGGLVH